MEISRYTFTECNGRRGGLMVSVLDYGSSGLGPIPRQYRCAAFLDRELYSHGCHASEISLPVSHLSHTCFAAISRPNFRSVVMLFSRVFIRSNSSTNNRSWSADKVMLFHKRRKLCPLKCVHKMYEFSI